MQTLFRVPHRHDDDVFSLTGVTRTGKTAILFYDLLVSFQAGLTQRHPIRTHTVRSNAQFMSGMVGAWCGFIFLAMVFLTHASLT
jgi:hypothetical protein